MNEKETITVNFKNLELMAEGDLHYLNEMKGLYLKILRELEKDYPEILHSGDVENLRAMTHRLKPSLKLLEMDKIADELYRGIDLLNENDPAKAAKLENSIRQMKLYCGQYEKVIENY